MGLLVVLALVGCRGGDGDLQGVVVELAVTPDTPHVRPTTLIVSLSDGQGPIAGATL